MHDDTQITDAAVAAREIAAAVDYAMRNDRHLGTAALLTASSDSGLADTIIAEWIDAERPNRDAVVAAVAKFRANFPVETMTEAQYLAHPADYRDIWRSERTDWPNWSDVRHLYVGKRTLMRSGGLEVEGITFRIVD